MKLECNDSFDVGDDMTRVQFTHSEDGNFWLEIIVYSSSPHYPDAGSTLKISFKQAQELAKWLQP